MKSLVGQLQVIVNQFQQVQAGHPVHVPMVHAEGKYVIEIIALNKNSATNCFKVCDLL
ncbi:hypothetical protein DPMN_102493 [Dreissena polymorpha]|uniref:Uncharacterized protein n=1 Tax=Dreissena polymorpha TaxID=45954 RepID=A0A9D4LJF4_DREPO|nr:hypothetical protein DPMN_102493 [Dreissena polymorpha]